MAEEAPAALAAMVTPDAAPVHLTFVAEALGKAPAGHAVPALVKLLAHESRLVLEGAIMGAAHHATDPGIRAGLESIVALHRDWLGNFAADVLAEEP